jgi:hypothetical protein
VLDRLYIWSNAESKVGILDCEPDEVGEDLHTADYVKEGRDHCVGVPRPGDRKYPYPHPRRAEGRS